MRLVPHNQEALAPDTRPEPGTAGDRHAIIRQLKLFAEHGILSMLVSRRDGSKIVMRPPIIVDGEIIQFCSGDGQNAGSGTLRFKEIVSIKERFRADTLEEIDCPVER